LWPDHPISYVRLPEDDVGMHYGAFIESCDEPVAVISLFTEPIPISALEGGAALSPSVRFRKFACEESQQGKGIGSALLSYVFAISRFNLAAKVVWCDARRSSADWYTRRGMEVFGETFFKGSVEYVRMRIGF
jgi:GNAT superfamily N-acetyltransferase